MKVWDDETLATGTDFGPYQIVRLVGRGAYGAVYEVVRAAVGRRMALKVLHARLSSREEPLARFEREAKVAGEIEHPNIVQVFDVGVHDGQPYMAMELLEGETLAQHLARRGALGVRAAADLFVPVVSALATLHARGVVHRDLKPGNIFLAHRRGGGVVPKLLDLGVAKDLAGDFGGELTRTDALVGSPAYMSPEQVQQAKTIDARSDQFSLGVILWECLAGRRLFEADTLYQMMMLITSQPIAPPSTLGVAVPREVEAALLRALERDPKRRHLSIETLGRALLDHCSASVQEAWAGEFFGVATAQEALQGEDSTRLHSHSWASQSVPPVASFELDSAPPLGPGMIETGRGTGTLPVMATNPAMPPLRVSGVYGGAAQVSTLEPAALPASNRRGRRVALGGGLLVLALLSLATGATLARRSFSARPEAHVDGATRPAAPPAPRVTPAPQPAPPSPSHAPAPAAQTSPAAPTEADAPRAPETSVRRRPIRRRPPPLPPRGNARGINI